MIGLMAAPAGAHTEFQASDPGDGTVVMTAIDRITVTFTAAAQPAGEGFVVLDASGVVREPDDVASDDGMVWVLGFDEPLPNGRVGVRWTVQAPDTHPIEGSFSFTVDVASPTPVPEPAAAAPTPTPEPAAESTQDTAETDLATFLDTGGAGPTASDGIARIGSVLTVTGAITATGVISFAALVLGGSVSAAGPWRIALIGSLALLAGALASLGSQVAVLAGSWTSIRPSDLTDVVSTQPGLAALLRIGAGALIGWAMAAAIRGPAHARRHVIPASVGAQAAGVPVRTRPIAGGLTVELWLAGLGGMAALASFAFDGHTVSEGPRLIHGIANAAHVLAGAIWVGGAGMLAYLSRRPHTSAQPVSVAAARFSGLATGAVGAVALTGITMTALVVDGPSDLWATSWGRLLLAKVAAVAAIGVLGLHNHRVVVPGLEARPDDAALLHDLRRTATVEAVLFLVVVALTGLLIVADAT